MYKRKTYDEYQLHINYGCGFEEVTSELSRREINKRKIEYLENDNKIIDIKVIMKRVKIQ